MTDTLSTTTTPVDTDRLVPKDSDGDPIVWDNNRATIEGVLHEAAKYWTKTDQFVDLVEHRAAALPSGKLALDHIQAEQFVNGTTSDRRSFANPCPPTEDRIRELNARRAAMVPPAPPFTPAPANPKFTEQFMLAGHHIRHVDASFLKSLTYIFGGTLRGKTHIDQAGNSGTQLILLLLADAKKATGRDRAVVASRHAKLIAQGVASELTSTSLDKYLKEYKLAKTNMPPAMRQSDEAELEMMNTIAHSDPALRGKYGLEATVAPPATYEDAVNLIKKILDDEEKADEIDRARWADARRGGASERERVTRMRSRAHDEAPRVLCHV